MTKLAGDKAINKLRKRIVAERNKRNWTQEELSAESGLDRSHVGFIEQGRRNPTISTLRKVAKAFKISLQDLLKDL